MMIFYAFLHSKDVLTTANKWLADIILLRYGYATLAWPAMQTQGQQTM